MMRSVRLVLIAALLGLLGIGCGSSGTTSSATTDASSPAAAWRLPDLEHAGRSQSLVALFDRDAGSPRVILLISPT